MSYNSHTFSILRDFTRNVALHANILIFLHFKILSEIYDILSDIDLRDGLALYIL